MRLDSLCFASTFAFLLAGAAAAQTTAPSTPAPVDPPPAEASSGEASPAAPDEAPDETKTDGASDASPSESEEPPPAASSPEPAASPGSPADPAPPPAPLSDPAAQPSPADPAAPADAPPTAPEDLESAPSSEEPAPESNPSTATAPQVQTAPTTSDGIDLTSAGIIAGSTGVACAACWFSPIVVGAGSCCGAFVFSAAGSPCVGFQATQLALLFFGAIGCIGSPLLAGPIGTAVTAATAAGTTMYTASDSDAFWSILAGVVPGLGAAGLATLGFGAGALVGLLSLAAIASNPTGQTGLLSLLLMFPATIMMGAVVVGLAAVFLTFLGVAAQVGAHLDSAGRDIQVLGLRRPEHGPHKRKEHPKLVRVPSSSMAF